MYLQKLEMQGFKSFADKMPLDFLPPSKKTRGITAVVGPNGSGKSNVADAIRWVLGEQSTKLLRGKKAEDVIFSGSEKRARSGFAEVTLHLNNDTGKLPIDLSEVTISRRIYRDGDSEYLINKRKVRLTDIQMLLAQAQFGARSYSVIGQGMIDNILVASPQERKEFFDEAAGVRQFQLKRHTSVIKMNNAKDNLTQAEMLVAEITPRMRSLSRSVKKLEQREAIEEDLHALHHQYYGRLWTDLQKDIDTRGAALKKLENEWKEKESTLDGAKSELAKLEIEETGSDDFTALQAKFQKLMSEKSALRERELRTKSKLEIAVQVKRQTATAMPLSKIIEGVRGLGDRHGKAIKSLRGAKTVDAARKLVPDFESIHGDTVTLADRLERPAPEEETKKPEADPKVMKELEVISKEFGAVEAKIEETQKTLKSYNDSERKKKEKFFSLQRGLQDKISAAHGLERRLGDMRVEMARLETRRDSLEQEMSTELGERSERIKQGIKETELPDESVNELQHKIQKLKYNLQLIGGIDPEVVREYEETKERYDFLESQISDLSKAISDLDRIVSELDVTIRTRSETAFNRLNREFDKYFKLLFEGGKAELIQLTAVKDEGDEGAEGAEAGEGAEDVPVKASKKETYIAGIDINATPPGKKIKHINMLSGGERALTSIALICAIMTTNPSPFVVLDEVDAALDESNADKFATILAELALRTQFIIITHNRYTMQRANVMYGVTMRDDGTSQLLSVNMDEAGKLENEDGAPVKAKRTTRAVKKRAKATA
ncbi:MAG: chromosome segregation SMC family protein [Patescibacteria group bacterium]|nr:chromosome segregation SMC family protein [Patescibacteria group bacterium]